MSRRRHTRITPRDGQSGNGAGILAALPVRAKVLVLALAFAIALLLAVTNALEYRSLDVASAEAAIAGQSTLDAAAPFTTCSADGQTHSAPYVITLTVMSQDSAIADTFYSVDDKRFVSGMLVSLTSGTHSLRFYSTDVAGHVEAIKSVTVTVQ